MSLTSTLAAVAKILEHERVPYMVIGGIASAVWGEPRGTRDIDVTIEVSNAAELVTIAGKLGESLVEEPVAFAEQTRVLPVRTPEGIEVDLIMATLSYELDAIGRARDVEVEGQRVKVCTAEDLVVHKIVSERPRDYEDVVGVLRRRAAELDLEWLESTIDALSSELGEPDVAERYARAKRDAGLHPR